MRRRPLLLTAGLVLVAIALLAAPAPAGAAARPATVAGGGAAAAEAGQQPDAPADDGTGGSAEQEDESDEPVPAQDIIPEPNSGQAPEEAGDRGGVLQILVFMAMVAAIGGGVALMVRESRRARARRA
jgi:hypothetical protein